jgi:hypothetical protein
MIHCADHRRGAVWDVTAYHRIVSSNLPSVRTVLATSRSPVQGTLQNCLYFIYISGGSPNNAAYILPVHLDTQNPRIRGICPSSGILENITFRKLNLFPSSGERRESPAPLGPLERANLSHWLFPARQEYQTMRLTVGSYTVPPMASAGCPVHYHLPSQVNVITPSGRAHLRNGIFQYRQEGRKVRR